MEAHRAAPMGFLMCLVCVILASTQQIKGAMIKPNRGSILNSKALGTACHALLDRPGTSWANGTAAQPSSRETLMGPRTSLSSSFLVHEAHMAKHPAGTTLWGSTVLGLWWGRLLSLSLLYRPRSQMTYLHKLTNLPMSKKMPWDVKMVQPLWKIVPCLLKLFKQNY